MNFPSIWKYGHVCINLHASSFTVWQFDINVNYSDNSLKVQNSFYTRKCWELKSIHVEQYTLFFQNTKVCLLFGKSLAYFVFVLFEEPLFTFKNYVWEGNFSKAGSVEFVLLCFNKFEIFRHDIFSYFYLYYFLLRRFKMKTFSYFSIRFYYYFRFEKKYAIHLSTHLSLLTDVRYIISFHFFLGTPYSDLPFCGCRNGFGSCEG